MGGLGMASGWPHVPARKYWHLLICAAGGQPVVLDLSKVRRMFVFAKETSLNFALAETEAKLIPKSNTCDKLLSRDGPVSADRNLCKLQ